MVPGHAHVIYKPMGVPSPVPFFDPFTVRATYPRSFVLDPSLVPHTLHWKKHVALSVPATWDFLPTSKGNYWCIAPILPGQEPRHPAGPSAYRLPSLKLLLVYRGLQFSSFVFNSPKRIASSISDRYGYPNASNLGLYSLFVPAIRPSVLVIDGAHFHFWIEGPSIPDHLAEWFSRESHGN